MENNRSAGAERPDPEVQAGRALRRLRLSQGWSQEEVAKRMWAYGYDFHQTTIAKIEAAQRPLRVRELAHFAALYEVEVHELIYPMTGGSLTEIDQDIIEVEAHRELLQRAVAATGEQVASARAALDDAQMRHAKCSSEAAMLAVRLNFLLKERIKFSWDRDEEPVPSDT